MNTEKKWMNVMVKVCYGGMGVVCSLICIMGYYPLLPAFYGACCLEQRRNILLYIGMFVTMGYTMSPGAMVKYLFILLVAGTGIRFYMWANRKCAGWTAGIIAGICTIIMNCSGMIFAKLEQREMILGLCEGVIVCGMTVVFHYLLQMSSEMGKVFAAPFLQREVAMMQPAGGYESERMQAFAEAVDELSVAFAAIGKKEELSSHESVTVLEEEITAKMCSSCDACAICWGAAKHVHTSKIRRMLQAVVAHNSKEDIIESNYMENCPCYRGMVEEAVWAFSRMELNEAWYQRLQENRMVIAGQLDAMADVMQDWTKGQKNLDGKSKMLLARIGFEVRERGLVAEQIHIYEDRDKRRSITAEVASKWGGGIPSKNYLRALEKATGMALRLQKDARAVLTRDPVSITAYEDTCFDAISGVATKAKEGAAISGDNFSLFLLENGRYNICLSDGMGSGPAASKESDMVVDLMEKFMEAGFPTDTAIRMMNSAMVLKGDDESYSTMDYATVDLYTGNVELIKIGAAASFLKHKEEVTCLSSSSLPAGVYMQQLAKPQEAKMCHGDFLVMVTDGVLEYLHVKNPEEKLAEMISEINTDNAGGMARALLEHVLLFTGGYAMDDMTIIVTGIWEK